MFFPLDELVPGDPVEAARSDGTAFTYPVVSVESFPRDVFPTALVQARRRDRCCGW